MSVGVSNNRTASKRLKTEDSDSLPVGSQASINLNKKEKPRNALLPRELRNSGVWRLKFLPTLMYWIGNSDYPWTIPGNALEDVLTNIYIGLCPGCRAIDFEPESFAFDLVCII